MSQIKEILNAEGFRFNKQFGQNFITDSNLLRAMVTDAGIGSTDTVVEVGAGAGTLTAQLATAARKVVAFEIDRNLIPVLGQTLRGLDDRVEVVFRDFQKVDEEELDEMIGQGDYKVVANLPYYITTPLIMRFLERERKPLSVSVMIQKEVGQRLVAQAGSQDYGAITLSVALEGDARIVRAVPRQMFTPQPNVDSCVVRIDLHDRYADCDKKKVKQVIKAGFAMRRKTLVNNLTSAFGITRDQAEAALFAVGLDARVRGESLTLDQYIGLSRILS